MFGVLCMIDGHFAIPQAAAIGHGQKAPDLLGSKHLPEALLEAQEAVTLAPNSVGANVAIGNVLSAMGQKDEARQAYERALMLAQNRPARISGEMGWLDPGKSWRAGRHP
jgi:Flp pilus assembly protein TadD